MKRVLLAAWVVLCLLAGCSKNSAPPATQPQASETVGQPVLGEPGETVAAVILGDIWAQYEAQERFSVYGGVPSRPTPDGPGDLDLQLPEKWLENIRYPINCVDNVDQGACLTHLLNETLFTAAAFRVTDSENAASVLQQWRREVQRSNWSTVAPERLLLAQVGEKYLIMSMGSKNNIQTFRQKLKAAYPTACIFCEEPITC